MPTTEQFPAAALLDTIVTTLTRDGAAAVVLTGSFARGEATPQSDIDVLAIGHGQHQGLYEWRDGRLIVATWTAPDEVRAQFSIPAVVGTIVPGWREAYILHDPQQIAAALQTEAHAWTWNRVDPAACDGYAAEHIAGLAEEALKLIAALERGRQTTAAVQRNLIALRMAGLMAVQQHILYGTENRLWDLLADHMGDPWASAQTRALGLNGDPFETTCRAALELYALTAAAVASAFNATQREIVTATCAAAGYPLTSVPQPNAM